MPPLPLHPEPNPTHKPGPPASTGDPGLTRRQALLRAGGGVVGLALGLDACGGQSGSRPTGGRAAGPRGGRRLRWLFDMALDDPGLPPVTTSFKDPRKLAEYGYDGRVVADW